MEKFFKFSLCIIVAVLTKFQVQGVPILNSVIGAQNQTTETVVDAIRNEGQVKASRFLGFLNGLNNLVNRRPTPAPSALGTSNDRNIPATTPRLTGRPGLGFIPDVSKGLNTILNGVATGNLEKVLEGSFVFAPNGVQLVAGNVLDKVFLSSTAAPVTQVTSTAASGSRHMSSQEAQEALLKIIQEQQNRISALQNSQNDNRVKVP